MTCLPRSLVPLLSLFLRPPRSPARTQAKLQETTREKGLEKLVLSVEPMLLKSLWGYQFGKTSNFLKITLAMPALVPTARNLLQAGIDGRSFATYESTVPFALRFLVDSGLSGGAWIEAPAGAYRLRAPNARTSNMQIELDVHYLVRTVFVDTLSLPHLALACSPLVSTCPLVRSSFPCSPSPLLRT